MPIPDNDIKERLSLAYISAVTTRAGYEIRDVNPTDYGIDGSIYEVRKLPNGGYTNSGWHLNFQAKATTRSRLEDAHVVHDLEAPAYDKLAQWEGPTPNILILFRLPEDPFAWLALDEEQLLLRSCCYWFKIPSGVSEHSSTIRIWVPRQQSFTPEALDHLFKSMQAHQP